MTARNISLLNATYSSVPAVQLPISGGGTATFTEITDTTATASDVATGKYFYTSAGVKTQGTNSGGGTLQTKSVTPTESAQVITADAGYDGLDEVDVGAISSTYVGSGVTKKGATTYQASTSDQTIPSGTYLTGTQTIKGYSVQSKTITANGTYTPSSGFNGFYTVTVNVAGGGGMNVQYYMGADYARATSYTATDVTLTVSTTGTYTVSWMGWRSTSSGTSGSQLYINGSAYGSAYTTFTGNYGQSITLTNVSLDAGDVLVVMARSRSTSYYMYVGNLIIEQTG